MTVESAYEVRSISRQDSHHEVTIERSTGRLSARARANASELHGSQRTVSTAFRSIIMMRMLVLRFATVLAIAVWIGGLLALGAIAAPSIFEVLSLRQVPDSRMLAGAIVGDILRRFHFVAYACGVAVILALIARAVLGPRPRRFAIRLAIAAVMVAAAVSAGTVITGRIERVQQEIGAGIAPSSLPATDPRRLEFGRLHGQSTLVQLIPLLGGLVLMLFELKD